MARIFSFFLGVLMALALCEIALRLADFSYVNFGMPDDVTGFSLRPNAEGWYHREIDNYVKINSDGLRDREHAKEKPKNTFRIAILGDSYSEAMQVPISKTFWAILERKLNTCEAFHGKNIEVINFGVGGFGIAQELLMLRHHAWSYSPDLILLAFQPGTVKNSSRVLSVDDRPFFVYKSDNLVLDNSFVDKESFKGMNSRARRNFRTALDYLKTLQLLKKVMDLHQQPPKDHVNGETGNGIGIFDHIYLEPQTSEWKEAWKITEALFKKMHDEVAAHGANLIITTLSDGIQVNPDIEVRKRFMQKIGANGLSYPDERIKYFGEKNGITVITLAPILRDYAEKHGIFLHGFQNRKPGEGHWNQVGHRLAGETLAQSICSAYR